MSTQEHRSGERQFVRATIRLPVTIIMPGDELVLQGETLDISRGGMRVSTATDLPAGQPILLRFTLPNATNESLVRGRIVLSFFDASSKAFLHGVAFTQYTPADQEIIAGFIKSAQPT